MSEQDIIETQVIDNDEYPQIPYADTENPGIASFNPDDFVVGENGHISATQKSGIPQYLGKIVGSGQGASSLNWKLDSGSIKPTEQVKIGDYVMLTDAYLNFKPGDIFRITFVQVKGSVYTVKTSNTKLTSLGTIESGGGKVYQHKIIIYLNSEEFTTFQAIGLYIYSNRTTPYTLNDFPYGTYVGAAYDSAQCGALAVSFEDAGIVLMNFGGVIYRDNEVKGVTYLRPLNHNTLSDTVTEL